MSIRVGINGLGRIGRCVFRLAADDPEFEIVAVNNRGSVESMVQLLKYDSVHGRFAGLVAVDEDTVELNGQAIKVFHANSPAEIPWNEVGVDIVIEATGKFKDGASCQPHIDNGAKKVVITAPGKDVDATIVMGVNEETYDKDTMHIVSNASCTTNCLAPFAKVLDQEFGIEHGFMNTIHAYTGDQYTLDKRHKDPRRARAAAVNEIPTSTGAAKAVGLVLPQLAGKLDGMATRVPVPDGSLVDLVAVLKTPVTAEKINAAMKAASEGPLKGILGYTEDPIVSSDIIDDLHSSIFDSQLTRVMGGEGTFVKCISWYDNEMGYSQRVIDLAKYMMA